MGHAKNVKIVSTRVLTWPLLIRPSKLVVIYLSVYLNRPCSSTWETRTTELKNNGDLIWPFCFMGVKSVFVDNKPVRIFQPISTKIGKNRTRPMFFMPLQRFWDDSKITPLLRKKRRCMKNGQLACDVNTQFLSPHIFYMVFSPDIIHMRYLLHYNAKRRNWDGYPSKIFTENV